MELLATLDRIRSDMRLRSGQLQKARTRLDAIGKTLDDIEGTLQELENDSPGRKRRRGRPKNRTARPAGPKAVDVAVEILKDRKTPMPCEDLARSVRSRGVDSGNNERSLRMSASKGKRLRFHENDVIGLP